jgi:pyruvate,orthophosphate dikinase
MVFGNLNEKSGTGILFTRNPNNGADEIYGEYLSKAQGEDIVSGSRTPLPLNKGKESMELLWPNIYKELHHKAKVMEKNYKNMQDIEFTVEDGKLWFLQSRNGKRNSEAALKISVDLHKEGLISRGEAIEMIDEKTIENCLHKNFKENFTNLLMAKGLPASSGCATGVICFDAKTVKLLKEEGRSVIFVAKETSPEDIEGIYYADGILTLNGGMTSHAAVVTRGLGKACVCGCADLEIDEENLTLIDKNGTKVGYDDYISINGKTGEVFFGKIELQDNIVSDDFKVLINWAKDVKSLKVRVNAETVQDLKKGIELGAEGVGLCRTEHMFFEKERLFLLRNFLLTQDREFLTKILTLHKEDFIALFEEGSKEFYLNKKNDSVFCFNIRFLDPPIHEFLPEKEEDIMSFSVDSGISIKKLYEIIEKTKEKNPMLGHRGCRLGITFPELYKMQSEAIFRAFSEVRSRGVNINIELMLPLIIKEKEFAILKKDILEVKEQIERELGLEIFCKIGTMIETPSACMIADELNADYYSFGTNDLTQTTLGISRDDGVKFLECYIEKGIIKEDPFATLSRPVKEIVKLAKNNILKVNRDPVLSICGEHGGDPKSIIFAIENDFSYVSCSPYRIPLAIFTAAKKSIQRNA